ncbi:hypothetical protein F4679DRAFT_583463 [Xylaria curta]|nr:hypothetical protein F4679DRAFT_583463 [Xylaria curta]
MTLAPRMNLCLKGGLPYRHGSVTRKLDDSWEHGGNSELTGPTRQAYLLNAKIKKRVCGGYRWNTENLSACHYSEMEENQNQISHNNPPIVSHLYHVPLHKQRFYLEVIVKVTGLM